MCRHPVRADADTFAVRPEGRRESGIQKVNCIYMTDNSDKYPEKREENRYLKGACGRKKEFSRRVLLWRKKREVPCKSGVNRGREKAVLSDW